jgi:hypothetical protein
MDFPLTHIKTDKSRTIIPFPLRLHRGGGFLLVAQQRNSCSDCFRLERLTGVDLHSSEAPLSRQTPVIAKLRPHRPARHLGRLPFANVRTAVHVQHLPGNVRGLG